MSNFIDLTGKRFGRLIAIKRVDTPKYVKNTAGHIYWLCKRDCGNEKVIDSGALKKRNTISCGCRQKDTRFKPKGYTESTRNHVYIQYKKRAKEKHIDFSLPKDEFFEIVSKNCFYCGELPSNRNKSLYKNGDFVYNGIDRIDNSKGYIDKNVVPCCAICNYAKRKMSMEDFCAWIDKAYNYRHK